MERNLIDGDAEFFGGDLRHCGARARQVDGADDKAECGIGVELDGGGGCAGALSPHADGDAAATSLRNGGRPRVMLLDGLKDFLKARDRQGHAIAHRSAIVGGVGDSEVDGIHAQRLGELVHHRLDGECALR